MAKSLTKACELTCWWSTIVIVKLKSLDSLAPVHRKQWLMCLRLLKLPVGLLINDGAATLKEDLHHIVNNLPPAAPPRELDMTLNEALV